MDHQSLVNQPSKSQSNIARPSTTLYATLKTCWIFTIKSKSNKLLILFTCCALPTTMSWSHLTMAFYSMWSLWIDMKLHQNIISLSSQIKTLPNTPSLSKIRILSPNVYRKLWKAMPSLYLMVPPCCYPQLTLRYSFCVDLVNSARLRWNPKSFSFRRFIKKSTKF